MDKIGIKLADGTFYPILDDGKPEKKNISLTTVKDNQTTVHVDLFRSPSGTMQDAQYIDTLEIDNLNPHTNGEPNLNFDIELDENGELSAGINDPETGKEASRHVNVSALAGVVAGKLPSRESDLSVKGDDGLDDVVDEPIELGRRQEPHEAGRTKEQLPATKDLKDMEDIFKSPEKEPSDEREKSDSSFDEIVNDISNIGKDADSQEASEVIGPSPDGESFSFDDFGDADAKKDEVADESMEEISAEEALPKDAEYVDSTGDEEVDTLGVLDASLDQPDFGFKALAGEDGQESPEDAVFAEQETEPAAADEPAVAADDESSAADDEPAAAEAGDKDFEDLGTLPDWSTDGLNKASDDSELRSLPSFVDDAAGTDAPQDGDDFESLDLPNLNLFEEPADDSSSSVTRSSPADDGSFTSEADDSAVSGDDFELPDLNFDDAVKEEADVDFTMPDFDSETSSSYSASSSSAFDDFDATLSSTADDWPSLDIDSTKSSGSSSYMPSNMFDNLYDKETMEGKSSDGYDDDRNTTKVPMFVCIACAIICILCLFFLFVIPTKFNVLRRSDSQEIAFHEQRGLPGRPEGKLSVGGSGTSGAKESDANAAGQDSGRGQSSAGELIKPASPASVSAPLPKVESVPAKENEIVIASVPSYVVPETPVKNVKKIPDIQYTVVWGDTLWDIASAYYKNPWKYTELAEYNHLKNPNFIQTGSVLLIPAE